MQHHHSVLQNGLNIVTTTMPDTQVVSTNLWVKAGARDETKEQNGIAHFLEHMAFKGTNKRSAQDIAIAFDQVGGFLNACTSREHTIYYAQTLKEDAPLAIDVLADIIQHSTFDKTEMEKERQVIMQELAMSIDTPDDIIFDYFQDTLFGDHAMGRPILGPAENIQAFTPDNLRDFIGQHYAPSNMILAVAGNIEHKDVVSLAQNHFIFDDFTAKPMHSDAKYQGGQQFVQRDLEQTHLVFGYQGISYHHEDVYAIQLLSILLGGGMSSRLFQEIREKRGLAYGIQSFSSTYNDIGTFAIYASCDPKHAKEIHEVSNDILQTATNNITEEELTRAKNQVKAAFLMGYERASFRADELGRGLSCLGRIISIEETVREVNKVTVEQVSNLLSNIINNSAASIVELGPKASIS